MDQSGIPAAGGGLRSAPSQAAVANAESSDGGIFLLSEVVFPSHREDLIKPVVIPAERSREMSARLLDLSVACALLIFSLPLMLFSALAVRASSPGPILYRQERIGRGGARFQCLKFRTMVVDADSIMRAILESCGEAGAEWQALQKLQRDPRVTPIGRFLRRYCLDELPQIFNVFAGEMSVVGPRPIVADEVVRYGDSFPDYCSVKPGLTGLWQVSGKHALPYAERVRLDADYARSKSVGADLVILWRTVPIVLRGENA